MLLNLGIVQLERTRLRDGFDIVHERNVGAKIALSLDSPRLNPHG
jgi:hypothetical protein